MLKVGDYIIFIPYDLCRSDYKEPYISFRKKYKIDGIFHGRVLNGDMIFYYRIINNHGTPWVVDPEYVTKAGFGVDESIEIVQNALKGVI